MVALRRVQSQSRYRDCSRLAGRVTRATCEDGHATATGGASHKAKSRGQAGSKTPPRLCSQDFPTQCRAKRRRAANRNLKLSRTSRNCRNRSRWPKPAPGKAQPQAGPARSQSASRASWTRQPPAAGASRRRYRDRAVRPAKPLKLKSLPKWPNRRRSQRQPHAPSSPKGAVVLSIGLPGSGKSTWFKRHNILPLSSDMVRILLFDDVTEQRYQDLVFSTLALHVARATAGAAALELPRRYQPFCSRASQLDQAGA